MCLICDLAFLSIKSNTIKREVAVVLNDYAQAGVLGVSVAGIANNGCFANIKAMQFHGWFCIALCYNTAVSFL